MSRRIVFQGELGANSHFACRDAFPDHEPVPCATFEDALLAVADGSAELGMIPIENSVAGRVADIHHLLPTAGLHIVGEYFLPLHHYLMAPKGASLQTVRTVHSHVMALGQCRKAIAKYGLKAVVHADTAGAAHEVADSGDMTRAAIASALAAEIYGLDILVRDIEDEAHNTTRFIVLAKHPAWAARGSGSIVTTFLFRVRNLPASLYKALGGFATNGINMTKLESYQLEGHFFASQFFADIEGHPEDPAVARAFEELDFFCREFKVLGVYRASPYRDKIRETLNGG
ncbi:prephenate dehydratase [Lutibaculum baratangense]|uniref:prephenate dehydratase n=1 Tax=Lutibaculum baratangense AMV1 TaxID=631454 RepID=V4THN0_9HYPH|nr:prephenate dehydratase [Lutibaculum baratangense]ESR25538.1 Prephenate dehydratase [Lutibaculum baratangense AMV1]